MITTTKSLISYSLRAEEYPSAPLFMKYYKAKTKKDFKFISSLFNPANNKYLIKKKVAPRQVENAHKNPNVHTFIIVNGQRKIGWFSITQHKEKTYGDFGMIINKPFQSKGYGFKIIPFIEKEAKKIGVKKLKIEVFPENYPAINIYEKSGFKKIVTLIRMEKKIKE
ncbi:GNAT family N-acetyltransferase [Candidatus Falkowbacteria bacterium]|nr:GNAT family N-acetyltransferase [Candidatus Falkowbacteria bacterium]